ncbi:MAG: Mov34/MPN/PAD-1 family protein [Anaerolineae bacterium]|nr:Mov34/MPN/PAD-1 family protein [Anaerolineae bacterium]MCO5195201.1 Mov34/MPN/PAD-1 family protein [Anaerolineae bacterium]MCO5199378.1 Mov34/MPN/PAD-1 family protein [Anaerolineae bacterium]MCO5204864.1 Mov34/MPN/PAD-1 family protein [Anaerolineae bacterium]
MESEHDFMQDIDNQGLGSSTVSFTEPPASNHRLPQHMPPTRDECVLHGSLPLDEQPRVVYSQQALQQIEAHCTSNLRVEVGGALLGVAYQHNDLLFVEVQAAIPAVSADHGPSHFTFTADVWAQLHRDREAYPELEFVGWFHTHPDLGVFFSSDDIVVHNAAFRQPWHVALVVDPVRNEACTFGWNRGEIEPLLGFYEFLADDPDELDMPRSQISWRIVTDNVFGGHYPDEYVQYAVRPNELNLPPISPWIGAILGGLGLAVSIVTLILVIIKLY